MVQINGEPGGRAECELKALWPLWPGRPLGPWLKWSGSRDICDYSVRDPQYQHPNRRPGDCGYMGERLELAGQAFDIMAFRMTLQARPARTDPASRLQARTRKHHLVVRPLLRLR